MDTAVCEFVLAFSSIIYFIRCKARYAMKWTNVIPNITKGTKFWGAQYFPELAFRLLFTRKPNSSSPVDTTRFLYVSENFNLFCLVLINFSVGIYYLHCWCLSFVSVSNGTIEAWGNYCHNYKISWQALRDMESLKLWKIGNLFLTKSVVKIERFSFQILKLVKIILSILHLLLLLQLT